MNWLLENKEWIFSGIGIAALSLILKSIFRSKDSLKQKQSSGSNSINIQAGNDVNIDNSND